MNSGRQATRRNRTVVKQFTEDGVSFVYPDDWRLEREETQGSWTTTLQSPQTAFLVVSYAADGPRPEPTAEAALEALRSEYPDLESESRVDALAGRMAVGHEINFFSFDLSNTAWTRSLFAEGGTLLVWWQANDLELPEYEPVLKAILASLKIEDA
jgi:hypothetical protein